jgi:Cu(I)/Ag(I) efflux system membrane fusion protein
MKRSALFAVACLAAAVALAPVTACRVDPGESTVSKPRYQCAMHPEIVSDEPGICPICQMKLQRVEESKPAHRRDDPAEHAAVPGHAAFSLSTRRQQLIGVTRAKVEERDLEVEIRAPGEVAHDPELYRAITEYREALSARHEARDDGLGETKRGADAVLQATRLRLRQLGLSELELRAIAEAGADPVNLLLPGKSVWVYARVYEHEIGLVHAGQAVTIRAPSVPGRVFEARVVAIDPVLDPATRTARVRALVETPEQTLRPESFAHVTIRVPLGRRLALPEEAVLDTGERRVVFVVESEGYFEPRAVALGREAGGFHEVLSGVAAGEEVVTSANFLIDSESRFRSALSAMSGSDAGGSVPAAGHAGHGAGR